MQLVSLSHSIPFLFPLVLGAFLLLFPHHGVLAAATASGQIMLSEIQITGGTKATKDEFVELYNPSTSPVNISDWELRKKTRGDNSPTGTLFHKFLPVACVLPAGSALTDTIPAHGYLLWTNKDGNAPFTPLFDVQSGNKESPSLAESNGLALFDNRKQLIDSVTWDVCPATAKGNTTCFPKENAFLGAYLEQGTTKWNAIIRDPAADTWRISTVPTPQNTGQKVCPETPPPPTPVKVSVRFNEILANPVGDETAGEFIELYNNDTTADISGFVIHDASKTGSYTFPANTTLASHAYYVLERAVSKLSLNNTNETLTLSDAAGTIIDTVQYQTSKEGVSLNFTGSSWRGGTPTPGTANQLNSLPETNERVPKDGYRGVAVTFNARGNDADNNPLKYTWDFGDGHKSYQEEITHTYEDTGTYTVTLTTSDGKDDTVETFSIKIEPLPEKKVRIVSFVPNPSGKDSDGEYLIIENREKKPVNLKDYGIATGWKKLSNHPVRESFIIAGKSQAKMTREFSLFTLPNQKGRIELRAPDGEVLQKIKYELNRPIAEDALYFKEKGSGWQWQEKESSPGRSVTETPTVPSIPEVVTAPEPSPPKPKASPEEIVPTPPEPKKLSLLPLLNYGTAVTLPDNIELTFADLAPQAVPQSREHYALTFAKEVLDEINTTLNSMQNRE